MKFIPFEKTTYNSRLSVLEIKERLENEIQTRKISLKLKNDRDEKKFEGSIIGSTFFIQRNIDYRNSFLPDIEIQLWQEGLQSLVFIKYKLKPFTFVFLTVLLLFITSLQAYILFGTEDFNNFDFTKLTPLSFLLIAYMMMFFGFNYETKRAKEELEKIIQIRKLIP